MTEQPSSEQTVREPGIEEAHMVFEVQQWIDQGIELCEGSNWARRLFRLAKCVGSSALYVYY